MINHCYVKNRLSWMKTRPMPKPSQEGVVPAYKRENIAECRVISSSATSENRRVPSGRLSFRLTSSIDLFGPKTLSLTLISWVTHRKKTN